MAEASTVERTKYKAIIRHAYETIAGGLGKNVEEKPVSEGKVDALAKIAEINALSSTKPDRRFPNTNQVLTCW